MEKKSFSLKARLKSFKYAFQGWKVLIGNEHNARIHLVAAIMAVLCGFIFKISNIEWMIVVIAIGLVFAGEAFNSAIEYLCNFVSPQYHDAIKKVKDLSALAVLFLAIAAFIAGLLIFLPKLLELCWNF